MREMRGKSENCDDAGKCVIFTPSSLCLIMKRGPTNGSNKHSFKKNKEKAKTSQRSPERLGSDRERRAEAKGGGRKKEKWEEGRERGKEGPLPGRVLRRSSIWADCWAISPSTRAALWGRAPPRQLCGAVQLGEKNPARNLHRILNRESDYGMLVPQKE